MVKLYTKLKEEGQVIIIVIIKNINIIKKYKIKILFVIL